MTEYTCDSFRFFNLFPVYFGGKGTSSEKNRFQNAFTVCNVALDSVVSDMFGKSATAITDYLTSDVEFDAQHCISLLQRSLKKKAPAVLEAVEGHEIAPEQKTRIGIVRDHLHYIDKLLERVDDCVEGIASIVGQQSSEDINQHWMDLLLSVCL